MAGAPKKRDFTDIDTAGIMGKEAYDVKLPNGGSHNAKVEGPVNFKAMLDYLAALPSTEDGIKKQQQAYTFHWRGLESAAAQKVRLQFDTVVTIPGTAKTLDLMSIPVQIACNAINVHDQGIKVLSDALPQEADVDTEDNDEMDEDEERAQRKNRAWNNAKRFLVESGKAVTNAAGMLEPNPNYTAPAVSGSSDLNDILTEIMVDEPKGKRGKKK